MMHTETPWRHRAVNGGWDGVVAETGEEICRLSYNNPSNADFIATACNAHEALVEACKEVLNSYGRDKYDPSVVAVKAALKKAGVTP